jgi:LuxR family maltose regulon positive regulatory protein
LRLGTAPEAEPLDALGLLRPALTPDARAGDVQAGSSKLLTPKERRILELLALNYSNKEIANALEVSGETIKSHLKKLFTKLDVGSRKQAVSRARTLGMLGFVS